VIESERLRLVPATRVILDAELSGDLTAFAAALGARIDEGWPPDLYGPPAMQWLIDAIARDPSYLDWGTHYFVLKDGTLVGVGGFKGAPADGDVEIGYSVTAPYQRRGLGSEATSAMVAHAFADHRVTRVVAHTMAELTPSIGVLRKSGFTLQPDTKQEGAIMFALRREHWRD
jgi:[ribosomal protein S5]-alanine N-acetyltransferase